jgi:predicted ATPase
MSILKSAVITGVWDEREIRLVFRPDVNFLIGPNGSGKTTAINLIAAMLTADYESLVRIPFNKITCILDDSQNPKAEYIISAERSSREGHFANHEFKYEIVRGKSKKSFELGAPQLRYLVSGSLSRLAAPKSPIDSDALSELVRIKWLSVHRTPSKARTSDQASSDSSVDRRLTQLGNQLVRYFSKLAAKREEETSRFLKQLFPILFSTASEDNAFEEADKIDLSSLRESIMEIIQQFGLASKALDKNLNTHFQLAESAKDKASYSIQELTALISSIPMRKVVEEWNRSLVRQANIAKPRRDFLEVINSMFSNKQLMINQRNELEALLPNGKHLQLSDLSSGEKQLLIIMAEALLQENAEFIYIADEPELSLHVRWQSNLLATCGR